MEGRGQRLAPLTRLEMAPNVWPLQMPDARPLADLPFFASRFVGRKQELAAIYRQLASARLLTLTGSPGTGKTRLALEAAKLDTVRRVGGAHLIELEGLGEGRLVWETFAATLGVSEARTSESRDAVIHRLRSSDALLVIDNCEHLLEACAEVIDQILHRCEAVTVLATSREALRIDGESVWPVQPLTVPTIDASLTEVMRSEAAQLFADRAKLASRAFELTKENAPLVAAICRKLDGLPLALELAAGRIGTLDLLTIAEQLDDRFRFLTGGFRTAPMRHRTLRAAIDWSYDVLPPAERQLQVRVSVFAGSFDAEAAIAVCEGGAVVKHQVADLLVRLAEKSLVAPDRSSSVRSRYRLLDSLRAYGVERLREAGELEASRRRHAEHYARLAWSGFESSDGSWSPSIRAEVDNLREALAWSRNSDREVHLRLAVPFGNFCMQAGFMSEGRDWLEGALAGHGDDSDLVCRAYETLALLSWRQDDFDAAERYAVVAVETGRRHGDEVVLARVLGTLAFVLIGAERFATVEQTVGEMLGLATRHDNTLIEAEGLAFLGLMHAHGNDVEKARDYLQRSAELEQAGGRGEIGVQFTVLGWMHLRLKDPIRARPLIATALEDRLRRHLIADLASSLDAAAELASVEGAAERAMRIKGAADALRDRLGSVPPSLARASRARWVPGAERFLGQAANKAWLEGRSLSVEEATGYALASSTAPPPRSARVGEPALSDRELEIAGLVAAGMSNAEIAGRLHVSHRTVDAHLDHIRDKLGARSRVDVATWMTSRSLPRPASRS